eukprot:ANDGO_01013.mRNA.1 Acyl-lipid (8-3)-desaturase
MGKVKDERKISWSEVEKHNKPSDAWLVIHGNVYNMTDFVKNHPGGDMIMMGAGRDASALFESHHPLKVTTHLENIEKFLVGAVEPGAHHTEGVHSFTSPFYRTLKMRVEEYFNKKKLSPRDSPYMYMKGVFFFACWIAFYYGTYFAFPDSMMLSAISAVFYGSAVAFVGINIMHDGNHGGYSNRPLMNWIAGATMDFIGGSSFVWKQIHQIGHHVHTNVDELDPDIHTAEPHFRRIKDSQKFFAHYAYQHIYLVALYSVLSIEMYFRDMFAVLKPKKEYNGVKFQYMSGREQALFWIAKVGFAVMNVYLPLQMYSWQRVAFLSLIHYSMSSYVLVTMFQVNHVVEKAKFFHTDPSTGKVSVDWAVMQLHGSSNFAAGSRLWNFISGGLNHQTEHHLFPAVCHVHYADLAPIVQQTAEEFHLTYNNYPSFFAALSGHWALIRRLGNYRPKLV